MDIRQEPEIFVHDREKPQILDGENYIENIYIAVGFASLCWDENGVFDTHAAMRVSNELCAYVRLFREGCVE